LREVTRFVTSQNLQSLSPGHAIPVLGLRGVETARIDIDSQALNAGTQYVG